MSNNKTVNPEVPTDLSQSFCEPCFVPKDNNPDGSCSSICSCPDDTKCCNVTFSNQDISVKDNNCSDENDSTGGVRFFPKKDSEMKHQDVKKSPLLNELFSHLFPPNLNPEQKDGSGSTPPNPLALWESMMRQCLNKSDDEESDDEESDDEESDDEESDDEYCGHLECNGDPRWNAVTKLIESHNNLTRTVSDIVRGD
jgi:hypothetical protein